MSDNEQAFLEQKIHELVFKIKSVTAQFLDQEKDLQKKGMRMLNIIENALMINYLELVTVFVTANKQFNLDKIIDEVKSSFNARIEEIRKDILEDKIR